MEPDGETQAPAEAGTVQDRMAAIFLRQRAFEVYNQSVQTFPFAPLHPFLLTNLPSPLSS